MSKKGLAVWILILPGLVLAPLSYGRGQHLDAEELKKSAPRIFIDCDGCDVEYIKTEITFINYVRDRKEAQVHVLITTQSTGGGGREYTLTTMGQMDYAGQDDVLKYYSNKTDTDDDIRKGLVQTLKIGLMRYVANTPLAQRIDISFQDKVKPTAVVDKWNSWVFSLSGQGYFSGQKSYFQSSIYGNISACRITPELKIRLGISGSRYLNRYDIEGQRLESTSRSQSFSFLTVKSLSDHWSLGAYFSLSSSSYSNIRFAARPAPAIEYDLFPYSQSTRRQLRFLYKVVFNAVKYMEESIYLKMSDNLWNESLSATLELKEKWGTISATLEGSHYFHDISKYNVTLYGEISVRLFKGFSMELYGSGARIHDQLSLPKLGASYEDVLLMRKQLATSFEYYFSIGLSYTFGSIYSNVVNPRFGS